MARNGNQQQQNRQQGRNTREPASDTNGNGGNNKPVHSLRYGKIRISIWANNTDQGTFYTTKLSRAYKDGNEWKHSDSFGRDDLLVVAKLCSGAFEWIHEQLQANDGNNDND